MLTRLRPGVVPIGADLLLFCYHKNVVFGIVVREEVRLQRIKTTLLLLLLKLAAQAWVGKTRLFINCFHNPTSNCETKTEKQTQGSNQRLTHLTLKSQKQCMEGHSTHESGPAVNICANWGVLHLDISNSNGWAAAAARVCQTLTEADGRKLTEQTSSN